MDIVEDGNKVLGDRYPAIRNQFDASGYRWRYFLGSLCISEPIAYNNLICNKLLEDKRVQGKELRKITVSYIEKCYIFFLP